MTTDINQTWLKDLDDTMRTQGRRILLLVDNASSHSDEGVNLTNVRVEKLPPNTTSQLQPLDQDIIYWVKRDVLSRKMDFALELVDDGTHDNPYKVGMQRGVQWVTRGTTPRTHYCILLMENEAEICFTDQTRVKPTVLNRLC